MFEDDELIDWRVRGVRIAGAQARLDYTMSLIDNLIEQHRPVVLALKKLHPRRSSPMLDQLVKCVSALARKRHIRLYHLSIAEMGRCLVKARRVNKRLLCEKAVAVYPSLARELDAERVARNPYHVRVLEAVVLGMACRRYLV